MSTWDRFQDGFRGRYGEGREDNRLAYYLGRQAEGKDAEGSRIGTTLGTNPTFTMLRDLTNTSRPQHRQAREQRGMGLDKTDKAKMWGQVAGTFANDLTQDHTRSLWWLLNAPQATANVIAELAFAKNNPDLFRHKTKNFKDFETEQNGQLKQRGIPRVQFDSKGSLRTEGYTEAQKQVNQRAYDLALKEGYIDESGGLKKGVGIDNQGRYSKRQYDPGDVASLMIPTGVAVNAGIGLLNPFGGSGGYEAVMPSEDDPTKTSNVVGEIAAKYILGRTGNLAPYEEFVKHRPDVDIGEYNRYKAFKYDKELDYDISDGDVNLVPGGVLKATTDGIHGTEVQFLGRSLPVTTTLIPYLGALAGGVAGVRSKRPIARGLQGGLAGLAAGSAVGLIAEEARRRASSNQNQMQGGNAEQYLGN